MQGNQPYLNFETIQTDFDNGVPHKHYKGCACGVKIEGKGQCAGYENFVHFFDFEEQFKDFVVHFSERFDLDDSDVIPATGDSELLRFHSRLTKNGNIRVVSPQLGKTSFPQTQVLVPSNPEVIEVFKKADMDYITEVLKKSFGVQDRKKFEQELWTQASCYLTEDNTYMPVSLTFLTLRACDIGLYNAAFGTTNGMPHMLTATAGLYPNKFANALLKLDRHVHKPLEAFKIISPYLDKALGLLYHHLGTEKYFGKLKIPITFDDCQGMSLGTSAGLNDYKKTDLEVDGKKIRITACGKKYETLQADIEATIAWMLDPNARDPAMWWKVTEKNENFFFNAQIMKFFTPEEWEEKMEKLRLYIIPSSMFVMLERLISKVRFNLEHGKVIQIGHPWPYGGMDRIAGCLKIDHLNELFPQLVEGDLRNMDQSTNERLINLFYSFGLIYDDPTGEDYDMRVRIIKLIIRTITARLTHLFGPTWAFVLGGVPSGILSTSHLDSWVVALYLFLFLAFQIAMAPPEHQDILEEAALIYFAAIVYGDDHVYNKTMDEIISKYFSGGNFQVFMKTYFDVDIRNMKDGVPFLSKHMFGKLTSVGMTFLKHQAVLNTCKLPGQCRYLPFRESNEFFVRIAWGKENRVRTLFDVILSSLGHAYGTYASNYDAWTGIKYIYYHAMRALGVPTAESVAKAVGDLSTDDIRDMRRKGISKDELLAGFPSWETLQKKNTYDAVYLNRMGGDVFTHGDVVW